MAFTNSVFDRLNAGKTGVSVTGVPMPDDPAMLLVTVEGYIETGNAGQFQTTMLEMLQESPEMKRIVIDMGKITYMASMGIGAFITILSQTEKTGRRLFLCGIPKRMEDIFRQLGFWDMFEKVDRPEQATARGGGAAEIFPARISCASCGTDLKVVKAGSFRCPSCRAVFSVDTDGKRA
jgi:anti-anti-sigma factor